MSCLSSTSAAPSQSPRNRGRVNYSNITHERAINEYKTYGIHVCGCAIKYELKHKHLRLFVQNIVARDARTHACAAAIKVLSRHQEI